MADYSKESLKLHLQKRGKIEIVPTINVKSQDELALAYTPGVAYPCLEIQKDISQSFRLTRRWNLCLVVTDGSAVLGLGDIGPEAGMPVMEGKCALFKAFGDVDAFPMCIKSKDVQEIVHTLFLLSGSFGGINLEDISAPRCFEIEEKLQKLCDIPVFHDDQHGTAIVVLAAVMNALKVVGKRKEDCRIVVNGAGAAGIAITQLLLDYGLKNIILCDKHGILSEQDSELNWKQKEMLPVTNPEKRKGELKDALIGADFFIGVSAAGVLKPEMVRGMNRDAVVFALANPVPEIMPDMAKDAGARIVGTGRSDFPNQINNVLVFPGMFRGVFDARATKINLEMKLAAAKAIADLIPENERKEDYIIPPAFDNRIKNAVSDAVIKAARATDAVLK